MIFVLVRIRSGSRKKNKYRLPSLKLDLLFFLGFVASLSARLRLFAGLGGLAYIFIQNGRKEILLKPRINHLGLIPIIRSRGLLLRRENGIVIIFRRAFFLEVFFSPSRSVNKKGEEKKLTAIRKRPQ